MAESIVAQPGITHEDAVQVEKTTDRDVYEGSSAALIAAGIIQPRHLEPQPGRRKGHTHFMPDGSPLPQGVAVPASLPGVVSVYVRSSGRLEVRRTVSTEERAAREDAEPTLRIKTEFFQRSYGTKERLLRDGISEAWLSGLPLPGKTRGRRVIHEGERQIEVSVGEAGINVDITHIDYYRPTKRDDWRHEYYLRKRAEFGLPLIVRKHLTLVWSAPAA